MLMFLLGLFALGAVVLLVICLIGLVSTSLAAFLGTAAVLAFAIWLSGKDWGISRMLEATAPPEPEKPLPKRTKRTVQPPADGQRRTSLDNLWTDEDDLA